MTLSILLSLGASLGWGTSSFLAGLQARRLSSLLVTLWSQIAGGIVLFLLVLLFGGPPQLGGMGWGLLAGLFGSTALVLLYQGMAVGEVSIVTAIGSCGALVPVLLGLAQGKALNLQQGLGIVVAMLGVVLVALDQRASRAAAPHRRGWLALSLALGAACGFGMFFIFSSWGTAAAPEGPLWVPAGARIGGLSLLLLVQLWRARSLPWPDAALRPLGLLGVVDTGATTLFMLATLSSNVGIVAVLGSLYPVVTILLSWLFLAERLHVMQYLGVFLALLGVVLLAGG